VVPHLLQEAKDQVNIPAEQAARIQTSIQEKKAGVNLFHEAKEEVCINEYWSFCALFKCGWGHKVHTSPPCLSSQILRLMARDSFKRLV